MCTDLQVYNTIFKSALNYLLPKNFLRYIGAYKLTYWHQFCVVEIIVIVYENFYCILQKELE
jgi:hypothetical protein